MTTPLKQEMKQFLYLADYSLWPVPIWNIVLKVSTTETGFSAKGNS